MNERVKKICLVIDLDETLVHSSFKPVPNADFIVPVEIDDQVHQVSRVDLSDDKSKTFAIRLMSSLEISHFLSLDLLKVISSRYSTEVHLLFIRLFF